MSSIWQDALQEAWSELAGHAVQTRQFRTLRLSKDLGLDAYAALRDVDDAPCLIIDAEVPPESLFEAGGMRLSVVAGEKGPLLVLSLEDSDRIDLFVTLSADAVSASTAVDPGGELLCFLTRLDAWRRFLRERHTGLSRQEAIGLLGELIVLERLVSKDSEIWTTWESPNDGLHDFLRDGHAVEIKTSIGPSSTIHISSLDQLDSAGLRQLDLLHARLTETPDGKSIGVLVSDISGQLRGDPACRAFENALLRRGLMPDDTTSRSQPRVELRVLDAYRVDEEFPRMTRSAVPAAVTDADYTLDLRALAGHTVDSNDVLDVFCRDAIA